MKQIFLLIDICTGYPINEWFYLVSSVTIPICLKINTHTEFFKKWTAAGRLNSESGNTDFSKHRNAEAIQILESVWSHSKTHWNKSLFYDSLASQFGDAVFLVGETPNAAFKQTLWFLKRVNLICFICISLQMFPLAAIIQCYLDSEGEVFARQ